MAATNELKTPELIGHERRWNALVNAFAKGVVPQTLLLSGLRHVGKTTMAKRYAQLLMCPNVEQSSTRMPCLSCKTCHQIEIEVFPDFKIYRPFVSAAKEGQLTAPESLDSSSFLISQARAFGDEAMYRPTVGARKVMVIAQADRMTEQAQQSLLKNFEEPIEGVHIVLLCENIGELLPTILSRCWHLPLTPAPDKAIRLWLQQSFDDGAQIEEAVRVARGLPGAAWREMQRLQSSETSDATRTAQIEEIVERILRSQAVGAFALTELALSTADKWGQENEKVAQQWEKYEAKQIGKKLTRSHAASFLDELSYAYWRRWQNEQNGESSTGISTDWADGLDQIRKTRHYILRNASTNLALDVLFGRLIATAQMSGSKSQNNSNARANVVQNARRF